MNRDNFYLKEIIFISLAEVISFHMQTNNYIMADNSRADIT